MDTEQYEEAVRDYEKVYQTEKTKGKSDFVVAELTQLSALIFHLIFAYTVFCFFIL